MSGKPNSDPGRDSDADSNSDGNSDAASNSDFDSNSDSHTNTNTNANSSDTEPERPHDPDEPPVGAEATDRGRTLHPMSVPFRSLSRSLSIGSLFFFVGVFASPGGAGTNLFALGAMVVAGIVVGIAYEFAYYRRFRYELTPDTFDVTSGVLSRRDREVPIRRVQNVDVRQNVVQRAAGIAAVHVETAGGGETEITLEFVGEGEARRLQRQLRRGSRDDERADAATDESSTEAAPGEPEEELLFEIRPNELAILSVFTIDPGASALATIALSFASGFDPSSLIPVDLLEADLPGTGLVAIAWAVLIFVLAAWILSAVLTFSRYYGFRLTRIDDELHYERGLLQRYSGTIPLEKVQTLTIKESIPFRWFGYGSLAVETAGYAPGQSNARGTESAIPLAERGRVRALARSVEPFGDEVDDLESSPLRARERYAVRYIAVLCLIMGVGYVLATYTEIVEDWHAFAALLFVAPVAAHLKWANRGFALGDRYFFARTGFWRRTTKIVPYYRVQSVVYTQTIFQRRRTLATVTADTASSASFFGRAATAYDVDEDRAFVVQNELNHQLQERLLERKRRRTGGGFDTVDAGGDAGGPNSSGPDSLEPDRSDERERDGAHNDASGRPQERESERRDERRRDDSIVEDEPDAGADDRLADDADSAQSGSDDES